MVGTNKLEEYLWWFHILGQNRCIPIKSKYRTSCIPQIVAIALFIIGLTVFYYEFEKYTNIPLKQKLVWYLFLVIAVVGFFVIGTSFLLPRDTQYVMHVSMKVIDKMNQRLNTSISSDLFIKKFSNKIKKFIIGEFIFFGILFPTSHIVHGIYVELFYHAVFLFYRLVAIVHVTFYIDLIAYVMHSMIERLEQVWQEYTLNRSSAEYIHRTTSILRHVKYYHYKMQCCHRVMNECFGWIIVLIVMETFLAATRTGYWAFIFAVSYEFHLSMIIRKYNMTPTFCFCSCTLLLHSVGYKYSRKNVVVFTELVFVTYQGNVYLLVDNYICYFLVVYQA